MCVKDGRAALAGVATRRSYLLNGLDDVERSRLMADPGPALDWVNSNVRRSDGGQIGPVNGIAFGSERPGV